MSEENKKTLQVYQKKAKTYIINNIEHDKLEPIKSKKKREKLEKLIKDSFASLPKNSKLFEIGSADGVNAKFMDSLGYNVTASDIADGFLDEIKKQNIRVIKFNALEDNFTTKYNGIFCWGVFVHFTKEDAIRVIEKVYEALEENGVFVFNAINREIKKTNNEWVDFDGEYHLGAERFYNYFTEIELNNIINSTKFKIEKFYKEGGENENKWLVYVLRKGGAFK